MNGCSSSRIDRNEGQSGWQRIQDLQVGRSRRPSIADYDLVIQSLPNGSWIGSIGLAYLFEELHFDSLRY